MKKIPVIYLFLMVICCASVYGQKAKLIAGQSQTIQPFYTGSSTVQIDTIRIEIHFDSTVTGNLNFILQAGNFGNSPRLSATSITLPPASGSAGSNLDTTLLLMTSMLASAPGEDQVGYIRLLGDTVNLFTVRLSAKQKYDPNKPFWIEAGANLDLVDGLKANNLFAAVVLYKKDAKLLPQIHLRWKKNGKKLVERKGLKNMGLYAGIFESKAISTQTNLSDISRAYTNSGSFTYPQPDSAYVFKDTGSIKVNEEIRNVSLFFSPQLRLSKGQACEDGIHFFLSYWAELQWQQISNTYDYSNLKRLDTILVPVSRVPDYPVLASDNSFEVYTHYQGIGLPVFFKEGDVNCYINPVFGWSNQLNTTALKEQAKLDLKDIEQPWKPFYAVQFRLNEEHYGFAFSGEVRGLLEKNNRPIVTLVLSKKFDLSHLLEF